MDSILAGIGILLFSLGLAVGIISGISLVQNVNSIGNATNWRIEAETAIVFMAIGVLMAILGTKKF